MINEDIILRALHHYPEFNDYDDRTSLVNSLASLDFIELSHEEHEHVIVFKFLFYFDLELMIAFDALNINAPKIVGTVGTTKKPVSSIYNTVQVIVSRVNQLLINENARHPLFSLN